VNYPWMGGAVSNYGFAAASTNAGHEGSDLSGAFAANSTETQIDFGYRAVHLSTVLTKNVVFAFYGYQAGKFRSYWLGCSSGGKQGFKEAQMYPDDYDGILAGSPAWSWSHLSAWGIYIGLLNPAGPGYLNATDLGTLHQAIIAQCDALDGLADGIVTNPALCKIDWAKTGLSVAQQSQAAAYYTNWTSSTGELLFPGFSPGAEELGIPGADGVGFKFEPDYFKYQVLNYTSVAAAVNVTFTQSSELERLVAIADKTNPGGYNADNYNITPFFHHGGKLLHYCGTQDQIINWGSVRIFARITVLSVPDVIAQSILYHERTRQTLGDVSDHYRLFGVPGMGQYVQVACLVDHSDVASSCGGGSKTPNVFGGDPGASGSTPSNLSPSNVCLCSSFPAPRSYAE
jgi:feruloyl esterase